MHFVVIACRSNDKSYWENWLVGFGDRCAACKFAWVGLNGRFMAVSSSWRFDFVLGSTWLNREDVHRWRSQTWTCLRVSYVDSVLGIGSFPSSPWLGHFPTNNSLFFRGFQKNHLIGSQFSQTSNRLQTTVNDNTRHSHHVASKIQK